MRINLFGQRNLLGGGRHFGSFADALGSLAIVRDAVHEFDYFSDEDYRRALKSAGPHDINIHFTNVNGLPQGMRQREWPKLPGLNIHWAIFESTIPSSNQIKWLSTADLVFVPSAWGRQVLINNGLDADKITVIPEGVDPEMFHPNLRNAYQGDDVFRVLVVGKYEDRKGFPELLDGYAKAFGDDPSCRLVLKSDSPWMKNLGEGHYDRNIEELQSGIDQAGITNSAMVNGDIDDVDMFHLYNACDLLLFPSRAEGWGLPLIEAIACGMPVATTFYSGHTEFLTPVKDKVGLIDHEMIPMGADSDSGEYARAREEDIAARLVDMRENIDAYRADALEASAMIRSQFSWQRAAEHCVAALQSRLGVFQLTVHV